MRREFDICLALIGIFFSVPVLALCAILIKLESPGPVFFRPIRVGRNGKRFRLWKLRTMQEGAEKGQALTCREDPRVTRVGRYLRRWKFDELPQFLNVLVGEMSLVGPRPETPSIVEQYSPEQRQVLSVLPGITGPSQIMWRHEEDDYPSGVPVESYYRAVILPQKLATDIEYVRQRSLWVDVRCLMQTIIVLIR